METFHGVTFLTEAAHSKKKWRVQILRCGKQFYLGTYATAEEACRAWDNCVYYTRSWAKRETPMNRPDEWEGGELPQPNEFTLKALVKLRELYPSLEVDIAEEKNRRASDALETAAMVCLQNIRGQTQILQQKLALAVSKLRLAEARVSDSEAEIQKRDRIIEGLRAQGSQQFFKKVGGDTVPATPVESHLG